LKKNDKSTNNENNNDDLRWSTETDPVELPFIQGPPKMITWGNYSSGHNHHTQFHNLEGWEHGSSTGRNGKSNYQNQEIAMRKSEENKSLYGFELVRKYGAGNSDAMKVLMETLMKYGPINFWCFVYDLDKKGIEGSDNILKVYNEHQKDLSKFVKSIWSGAQGVIDDIDSGKSRPS